MAAAGLIAALVLGVWLARGAWRAKEQTGIPVADKEGRRRVLSQQSAALDLPETSTAAKPPMPGQGWAGRERAAPAARAVSPPARADTAEPSEERIKAIETWEGVVDKAAEREGAPTDEQAGQFKREFAKLDKADQLEGMQTALNLLPDEQFALLYPILFDKTMDPDILDAIFSDGLNHDDDIKIPMMKAICQDKEHPLSEEAWRILEATGELDEKEADEENE